MNEHLFELNITVIGTDIFYLIDLLRNNGFETQANNIEIQVETEINLMQ